MDAHDSHVEFPDGLKVVAAIYGYVREHREAGKESWLAAQAETMYRGITGQTG